MRRHHRYFWVLGLAAGLAVATCSFPTDKSDEVYVVLTPSDTLLARGIIQQGQTDLIFAQTWRRLPNGDSAEVLNVDYHWASDRERNRFQRVARAPHTRRARGPGRW